ncbi:hypothetical protein BJ875DRAFT_48379 [Amylocarpus encephaloides]|uniref:Extracellular membrane protein CFEM domain-containing protein n=1 Tax=Amylocarpus encephaloides TaxID=45428 RepID=A0A9P8C9G4_9HELO|nr:hypothetical protein BJ875DRAFT_48379 [Amylocarpus encephaloides]
MKSFLILSAFTTAALAQVGAIPHCAKNCFSSAVDRAGCISYDGGLDLVCACTSYSLRNRLGGRDTGISYARDLCRRDASCSSSESSQLSQALNDICYNDDYSPKYYCGLPSGQSVATSKPSISATGTTIVTVSLDATSTDIMTIPVYQRFTTTITSYYVWTTRVITASASGETTTYTTTDALYLAVCPTTVPYPRATNRYGTTRNSYYYTSTSGDELFNRISSAEASKSSEAATQTSSKVVTSDAPTATSSAAAASNGTATETSSPASSAGRAVEMGVGLVGVMGLMAMFA